MIYLASPYSHPRDDVRYQRAHVAAVAAGLLIRSGHKVISPIVHSHPIAERFSALDGAWDVWADLDLELLDLCTELWVLDVPGWDTSVGVAAEIAHAHETNTPVFLCTFTEEGEALLKEIR